MKYLTLLITPLFVFASSGTMSPSEHRSIHGYNKRPIVKMQNKRNMHKLHKVDEEEATKIVKEKNSELLVEGPIQYDAAVNKVVAKTKLPNSKVAGRATVFIFPDLNTGNNTYKAVQRSSDAVAIGPILQGLNKPVNDLSRGCLVADIVNTVAITAIQAGQK